MVAIAQEGTSTFLWSSTRTNLWSERGEFANADARPASAYVFLDSANMHFTPVTRNRHDMTSLQ